MDPARWNRMVELFNDLVELDPEVRSERLEKEAGADPLLAAEVAAMLAAHESPTGLAIERRLLTGPGREGEGAFGPLAEGTRVGSYRVGELVGVGGMGEVYRAERVDGEYRQTVALKLLRPGFHAAEAVGRFRRERQLLARLVHPDIAPILDGGTAPDGRPYLVLQFVEGVPITRYCEREGLDLAARLRLFRRVAEAVQFAHGRLVVHRDLKPSNILVQDDGSPRLLDFGIAKLLEDDDDATLGPATRPGFRPLTPEHAAPEQIRGEAVGTAADVYGLGVLLFELVAGRRPFVTTGRASEEFARTILTQPAPPPSAVAVGPIPRHRLRGDLDRIVAVALRKEPERRYRSAGEMAEDVDRFLAGLPVRAQPDTVVYRVRKFVGRHRVGVAGTAVIAAALVSLAVTSTVQARRAEVERDRAEARRIASEEMLGVLTSVFRRTNPRLVPGGDTLRVSALLDEAEAGVEALEGQPQRQLALWRAVGQMRMARGEHARARDLLARAWAALGDRETIPETERVGLYHEWALAVLASQGTEAALPMLERSLERHRALLGGVHADLVVALEDRASADPDAAVRTRLLAEARRVREALGQPEDMTAAALLNGEGTSFYREGRMGEALVRFEEALGILADQLPPEHPDRLAVAGNVASSLVALGRWSEAQEVLQDVLARAPLASPPGQRAVAMENLALTYAHQGAHVDAEALLRRSLDLARDSAPQGLPNTFRNLGALLTVAGRPAEALPLLDSALATLEVRGGDPGDAALMRAQRGLILADLGRTEEGLTEVLASAAVVREVLSEANGRRGDAELWAGITALQAGNPGLAEAHFDAAIAVAEAAALPGHPRLSAARCGRAVARAVRGTGEPGDGVADCEAYSAWGIAHPYLVEAARGLRRAASPPGPAGAGAEVTPREGR